MARRIVFLGPFSNVSDRIMPMSDAVSSEGPKTRANQQRSSALSLTHRDFSSFSESFDVMLDVLPAEYFQIVLLFQPFVAPVPTFLRPVAGIKFEMSSFSG